MDLIDLTEIESTRIESSRWYKGVRVYGDIYGDNYSWFLGVIIVFDNKTSIIDEDRDILDLSN